MTRTDSNGSPNGLRGSLFLDSLCAHTLSGLAPHVTKVSHLHGQVLARPGRPTEHVDFPLHSVVSTITMMGDGSAIEVGLTGREGLVGPAHAFGTRTSLHTTVVQIPGDALRLDAGVFEQAVEREPDLRDRVRAFAHYIFTAAAQFTACNRLHPIEERYARWLLMVQDRTHSDEIPLTQEFTAEMLGVRRAGVTVVAGRLNEAGLITVGRSRVTVRDRRGLEKVACECYSTVNDALRKLLGVHLGAERQPSAV
ncbi:MAG TPA: Crp/Fnr family transcriptional regulator [Candidatus Elarobacter sp.]|nr:Crp/Fnr family transcriptional regulator [Candidatus Elarobacter sp.]